MIKLFHSFNDTKQSVELQNLQSNSTCQDPKMSVKEWYELQHKLRLQQMAQARATD